MTAQELLNTINAWLEKLRASLKTNISDEKKEKLIDVFERVKEIVEPVVANNILLLPNSVKEETERLLSDIDPMIGVQLELGDDGQPLDPEPGIAGKGKKKIENMVAAINTLVDELTNTVECRHQRRMGG